MYGGYVWCGVCGVGVCVVCLWGVCGVGVCVGGGYVCGVGV